jgi:hypothetical protein
MKRQFLYDHSKLEGMDADIEISLKEHGIAWIETKEECLFYYGVIYGEEEWERFDVCSLNKGLDFKKEFDWIDWDSINSYIGMNFDDLTFPQKIADLITYYGYQNIFGDSYCEGLTYTEITGEK